MRPNTAPAPACMAAPMPMETGLCVLMWDADHWADEWFGTVLAAYVVSLILLLPAAFCIGFIVRTAEALWETASWARDAWRYRRRAP